MCKVFPLLSVLSLCVQFFQLQAKGEVLIEREREMMEVKTRLEGENADLHRDLDNKNKVHYMLLGVSGRITDTSITL